MGTDAERHGTDSGLPPHLREWREAGRLAVAPPPLVREFAAHLDALLWAGSTGLTWTHSPAKRCPVEIEPGPLSAWLLGGALRGTDRVLVLLGRSVGVLVSAQDFAENPDELTWTVGPGPHFACAVGGTQGHPTPDYDRLVQYGVHEVVMTDLDARHPGQPATRRAVGGP